MIVLHMLACAVWPPSEPLTDSRALNFRCQYNDLQACYGLRNERHPIMRGNALRRACRAGYRDSCRILFDWKVEEGTGILDRGVAVRAALDGCVDGDLTLCSEAFDFVERHPELTELLERRRAEVEAVMRGGAR